MGGVIMKTGCRGARGATGEWAPRKGQRVQGGEPTGRPQNRPGGLLGPDAGEGVGRG